MQPLLNCYYFMPPYCGYFRIPEGDSEHPTNCKGTVESCNLYDGTLA